jgi:hypothetical protein
MTKEMMNGMPVFTTKMRLEIGLKTKTKRPFISHRLKKNE